MNEKEQMYILGQMFEAVKILVQRSDLQEKEMAKLSGFYPIWEAGKAYSNGTFLRYGTNADFKSLLYATTKNMTSAAGQEPDKTPGSYRLIG